MNYHDLSLWIILNNARRVSKHKKVKKQNEYNCCPLRVPSGRVTTRSRDCVHFAFIHWWAKTNPISPRHRKLPDTECRWQCCTYPIPDTLANREANFPISSPPLSSFLPKWIFTLWCKWSVEGIFFIYMGKCLQWVSFIWMLANKTCKWMLTRYFDHLVIFRLSFFSSSSAFIFVRGKNWIRDYFLFPVFDEFRRFGIVWIKFENF